MTANKNTSKISMPDPEQLKILLRGPDAWNEWRDKNPLVRPNLTNAELSGANLTGAFLWRTDLSKATLIGANLAHANLSEATLVRANLFEADLSRSDLRWAALIRADLRLADLSAANLCGADLRNAEGNSADLNAANLEHANLSEANFSLAKFKNAIFRMANIRQTNLTGADLTGADFHDALAGWTIFVSNDLSTVNGLEDMRHSGPSRIGVDTLYQSQGNIPAAFLRDVGMPDELIVHIRSLVDSVQPLQFHSCFISYSHRDLEFAKRLHNRMRAENLRVWYAPEEMEGGKKLHEQIFGAIQIHDKLLLVLSDNSMKSEWVVTEIRRAMMVEREENRRKLFPIRLVDFEAIEQWECFDADTGRDLAREVRQYYIPDFSKWHDEEAFEREFAKLLRSLRTGWRSMR